MKIQKWILKSIGVYLLLLTPLTWAANEVINAEALKKYFHLNAYLRSASSLQNLKIAVLDNGFEGFQPGKGLLPETTELKNLTPIGPAPTSHGLGMAQIIWAMTGKNSKGPKFYLVNTNGFSNFKAAASFIVEEKVDLVLYSQVWPFGSNFDGTGFINEQVSRAIEAGVIWVNAAGNHGGMVYNGFIAEQGVLPSSGSYLKFQGRDALRFENKLDENSVSITLSWSDFQASEDYKTTKDLDLFLVDASGKQMASSELIQRGEAPEPNGEDKLSSHAREVITFNNLDRGNYQIKIRVSSNHFEVKDRFRVLLKSEKTQALNFIDRSMGGEIMPPADHPLVVTVGESRRESAIGPTTDGRVKPEVILDETRVMFSNGVEAQGSSVAGALFMGILAAIKAEVPDLSNDRLRRLIQKLAPGASPADLVEIDPLQTDFVVSRFVPEGGKIMRHRFENRFVILTAGDPYELPEARALRMRRIRADDILVVSPYENRWWSIPASLKEKVKYPLVEFRIQTGSMGSVQPLLWKTPSPTELRRLLGQ